MDSFHSSHLSTLALTKTPSLPGFPKTLNDLKKLKQVYDHMKLYSLNSGRYDPRLKVGIEWMFPSMKGYKITRELGAGSYGRAFEAMPMDGSKGVPVVMKINFDSVPEAHRMFQTEAEVLKSLGRLIDIDERNLITVQTKIDGINLHGYIKSAAGLAEWKKHDSILKKQYHDLYEKFYEDTGKKFIHGDIRPENVILKPDGELVLIDFGMSQRALPEGTNELEYQLYSDYIKASKEEKLDVAFIEFRNAVSKGDRKEIKKTWEEYIDRIDDSGGREELAQKEQDALMRWQLSIVNHKS